ncbi:YbaB/EbfC family nucleoid-associated protein [Streptosporangium algeriense]|uniref:YbaB/EbfC family nucleoid-associated protein n=1 Tax=Streptosporangium algeriense TaxID=1682748 RepID=A0ABW3DUR4_9ACTN
MKMEELQKEITALVGRAQDEDGMVTVEYAAEGLRELELHPKAMRLGSGELAERIKEVFREASRDLQRQLEEATDRAFGEQGNPMRVFNDPEGALGRVKEAEAAYDRTFQDVMGELDRIRRRLEL